MADEEPCKPLHWIGSTRKDVHELSGDVRSTFGFAFYRAQLGHKHIDAKPLKGFGGGSVLEVIADDTGGTYRAVYTVKLRWAVYVLHVFKKKSKKGIVTPKEDVEKVKQRLKQAIQHHKVNYEKEN